MNSINGNVLSNNYFLDRRQKISSDKLKIGCYILAGATLMGSLIYSVCTKKMTPSISKNLDNTDEAACNMAMVGDFIDAIA